MYTKMKMPIINRVLVACFRADKRFYKFFLRVCRSLRLKYDFCGVAVCTAVKKVARNCGRHGICVCDRPLDACFSAFVSLELRRCVFGLQMPV